VLDFHPLLTGEGLVSLVSLASLEIVLGIDNIVFIAIVSERIEAGRRSLLRRLGLGLALIMRLGLLFALSWLMGLTRPVLSLLDQDLSARDLVLLGGGLFLIAKASHELFARAEPSAGTAAAGTAGTAAEGASAKVRAHRKRPSRSANFGLMLAQILILDIVFSLDSVITAVGMARQLSIMMLAMVIAVVIMLIGANVISEFIQRHPSMKVLALSFLLMVGVLLVADAFDKHISKGYVYFAMAYALAVELFNMRRRQSANRRTTP
jgi:predicted tellurium resistance membrane protein TerC